MLNRIVTHDDFDGIISAAITATILNIKNFFFTGPRSITESRIRTSITDVVCDLPYPAECGMWFDHHSGNLEELQFRGIKPDSIPGKFAPEPSCARVIFDFFSETHKIQPHHIEMAAEADIIDAFAYSSIADWQRETPGKIIETAIRYRSEQKSERLHFLTQLTRALMEDSLGTVAAYEWVSERYQSVKAEETATIEQIKKDAVFHESDPAHEIVIIDRTHHKRQDVISKNMAYVAFPEALAVIEIKNRFRGSVKTNDLAFSMSLSLNLDRTTQQKDVGEIMRLLNAGDGHPGAGAGSIDCRSKEEMLKTKNNVLDEIFRIWREM